MVAVNGPAFREIRVRSGIKTQACADLIGISRAYLAHVELGSRTHVSPTVFTAMLRALGITDRRAILANPYGEPAEETQAEAGAA
jgi:transcriptional regulator with XRE-family HTH domain